MNSGDVQQQRIQTAICGLRQFRLRQRRGMDLLLPGLFVGSLRDAQETDELRKHEIKFIVSVLDFDRELDFDSEKDTKRLIIKLSDDGIEDIIQHIPVVNDFIHAARLSGGSVLIHCLVGVSRSICIAAAYLMSVTKLSYAATLAYIETRRSIAKPNFGFRMQLCKFSCGGAEKERERLRSQAVSSESFDSLFHNDCLYTHSLYSSP
ncbi:hypothetical protein FO519_001646 [Halicephalobus sp. NKZ332]|nr:hypothetical protein FO519_001646 [Halicephalobus sp. NKZ332]